MKWGVRKASKSSSGLSRKERRELKKLTRKVNRNDMRISGSKRMLSAKKKALSDVEKNKHKSKYFKDFYNDGEGNWALPSTYNKKAAKKFGGDWRDVAADDIDLTITKKPTKAQLKMGYEYITYQYKNSINSGKKYIKKLESESNTMKTRINELNNKKKH